MTLHVKPQNLDRMTAPPVGQRILVQGNLGMCSRAYKCACDGGLVCSEHVDDLQIAIPTTEELEVEHKLCPMVEWLPEMFLYLQTCNDALLRPSLK